MGFSTENARLAALEIIAARLRGGAEGQHLVSRANSPGGLAWETPPNTTPGPVEGPSLPAAGSVAYDNDDVFQGSFWDTPLASNAPLESNSALWASNFCQQMRCDPAATGDFPVVTTVVNPPWLSVAFNNTSVYVVDDTVPLVGVANRYVLISAGFGSEFDLMNDAMLEGVPIPEGMFIPATADHAVTIYQPSSDTIWEFIGMYPLGHPLVVGYEGPTPGTWEGASFAWTCSGGGRIHTASDSIGGFANRVVGGKTERQGWGASATALPYMAGLITPEEMAAVRSGAATDFGHALKCSVGNAFNQAMWPARRTDGEMDGTWIPEGARIRLPANLSLTPYAGETVMVRGYIKTLRDYGMVVHDKTGGGVDCPIFRSSDTYTTDPYVTADFGVPNVWNPSDHVQWRVPWHKCQIVNRSVSGG